ncbi:hypothetical protein GC088_12610 [Arthrobacter sp. JZ12]|uniref:hypothetical protein n=1 Tax=Arthrobacter sp. JZ12 TaxID=2654190 RepID=UPI002B47D45A|nr:hypothetical protein [Arthrobacter sp. JZ12]WRH25828.1 hypothetical protein GC088_12610 [Arthrobacter sp. JZ12]
MDLQEMAKKTRLARRDPGAKQRALSKFLLAQEPESIVQLHEAVTEAAERIRSKWQDREGPRRLFESQMSMAFASGNGRAGGAPPMVGGFTPSAGPSYDEWLWGWCIHQVLLGNLDPEDGHFDNGLPPLQIIDYFEGMMGPGLLDGFRDAYEERTGQSWPLKPRQGVAFLFYQEQQEHSLEPIQLYRASLRELTAHINGCKQWRTWWMSGPLTSLEFGIVETDQMLEGNVPTEISLSRTGLAVTAVLTPSRDRIANANGDHDVRAVAAEDVLQLLEEVSSNHSFDLKMPQLDNPRLS